METHKGIVALLDDYDPTAPSQLLIDGQHALSAYLDHHKARIQFLYALPAGETLLSFEMLLNKNKYSADDVVNMFCAAYQSHFSSESPIEALYQSHFLFDENKKWYLLDVKILAIDSDGIQFAFKDKSNQIVKLDAKNNADTHVRLVKSTHMENELRLRKQALYRKEKRVNGANLPEDDDRASRLKAFQINRSNSNVVNEIKNAIGADPFFPTSLLFLMNNNDDNTDKKTTLKRNHLKKILSESYDDDSCINLKESLEQLLNKLIEKYTPKLEGLTKQFNELMQKNKALAVDVLGAQAESLLSNFAIEEAKKSKYSHYVGIKKFLDQAFFPYMKQSAIVYLFLDHVVDYLYDPDETNPEQELYNTVNRWMLTYRQKHLMRPFDIENAVNQSKDYVLADEASKHSASHYINEIVHEAHDLFQTHDVLLDIPADHRTVHFSEDTHLKSVSISLDNGFKLRFKSDEFYANINERKLRAAKTKLFESNVPNALTDGGLLSNELSVEGTDAQLFDLLTEEEKICWMVSYWIIDLNYGLTNQQLAQFKKNVDKLIEENPLYDKAALLDKVSFYIMKHADDQFTVEQRKAMIRIIYNNHLPSSVHQNSEKSFMEYVAAQSQVRTKLMAHDYLADFDAIARPAYTSSEERLHLLKLTNMMKALSRASFLDSKDHGMHLSPALIQRRDCLIELLFHGLVEKVDPLARKEYQPNSYHQGFNTLVKWAAKDFGTAVAVDYKPEPIVANAYAHVDAFLKPVQEIKKSLHTKKPKRAEISPSGLPTGPSLSTGRDRSTSNDGQSLLARSIYQSNKIVALNNQLQSIRDFRDQTHTMQNEILSDDDLKQLNQAIEGLNPACDDYLNNLLTQEEFNKACLSVETSLNEQIAALPAKLEEAKAERARLFDAELKSFNELISQNIQTILKNKTLCHHEKRLNKTMNEKVRLFQINRDDFVSGKMSHEDCVEMALALTQSLEGFPQAEENRLQLLYEERKDYKQKEIEQFEACLKTIQDTYFPLEPSSDETAEKLVSEIFGRELFEDVNKDVQCLGMKRLRYIQDDDTKESLDVDFILVGPKMDRLEAALRSAVNAASDFLNQKENFNQYLSASLATEHINVLDEFHALKSTIENRGFFARLRSFFGFEKERQENEMLKAQTYRVRVIAMMVDGGLDMRATDAEVKKLENFSFLDNRLREISIKRKQLDQNASSSSPEKLLYDDVEIELKKQLSNIALRDKILAIKNERDQSKRERMVSALLYVQCRDVTRTTNPPKAWVEVNASAVVQIFLTMLARIFGEKKSCKESEPHNQSSQGVVGFSSGFTSQFASKKPQGSLEPGGAPRSRSLNVVAK